MCQMANTATMGEEAVLTTPALPRVGPPKVSPWHGDPATTRSSALEGMFLARVAQAGWEGSSSCHTSSQRGEYEAVAGSVARVAAQCRVTAVLSCWSDSTNQEGPIRSRIPSCWRILSSASRSVPMPAKRESMDTWGGPSLGAPATGLRSYSASDSLFGAASGSGVSIRIRPVSGVTNSAPRLWRLRTASRTMPLSHASGATSRRWPSVS